MEKKQKKFLTVAPFECAWHDDLRFREAGRGCVAFDAFAHNDVTIVFRENAGSQHYHYKRDNSPHYTVIIGSHRNKRLNIEVSGKTVVDVAGVDLCCSSTFQSYWISIYDGLISIGKGRYPFQNLVFQWLDSNPNRSVQYVGLSSWDRHVGYRNFNVLPLMQNHISLWKHVDCGKYNGMDDADEELQDNFGGYENWGLQSFLENWDLSDVIIIVGAEERAVPAHKVILAASGNFGLNFSGENCIHLQDVSYPILHALLEYIYTGYTSIQESHLNSLKSLSFQFEVITLARQCEEMMERFKLNKKLFDSGRSVEISYPSSRLNCGTVFLNKLPIDVKRLNNFRLSGEYTDVDIYIEGHGKVARSHRIILGFWSVPFTKDSVCQILQVISSIPSCKLIEETCERKFSMNFDYCTTASIDFVMLDKATFGSILQHPDLTVTSEERVLNAIFLWFVKAEELFGWDRVDEIMLNSTPELTFGERLKSVEEFLSYVRFSLLSFSVLKKLEKSNLCRRLPALNNLVKEATSFLEIGVSGNEKDLNVRFQHRRSSFKELQYICNGDGNGVLYFAGTSYGEHQWVNPVLSKKVSIMASSPLSRFTDPKVLVSRTYQGTSFAGPRMEGGRSTSWWTVDIGHSHQLICNYYTVRQDGSRAFIRNWSFQGSMDGNNWTNLRVHENDVTICKPGQFASWPIVGSNTLLPFRFFRLVLTGTTTDATNPWNFCICFLELYGYFR